MSKKRKIPTIDLTSSSSPSKAAFDPKVLLNPRAALRKQASSPEKEFNVVTALEKIHGVQERKAPVAKRPKKEVGNGVNQNVRSSAGVVGTDLQIASKKQIALAKMAKKTSAVDLSSIIDISDGNESLDEDVKVLPNNKSSVVCFGMLKASINAFSIPQVPVVIPAQWPKITCEMERGNGNIIHVKHKGGKFGVISSDTAAPLSRLMQLELCRCEGRIPARPRFSKDGENLAGISAILPFEIIVYGEANNQERIAYDRSFAYVNPHVRQAFKASGGKQYGTSTFKTAEEIKSEIESLFNKIQNSNSLKEYEQPAGLRTMLLKHQKQALTFCLEHESIGDSGSDYSVWQELDKAGKKIWRNKITPQVLYKAPTVASGGIIADEMGLGKTLSLLSLIWVTRAASKAFSDQREKMSATLIVCPLSVLSNWTEQIATHLDRSEVEVLVHHDKTRVFKPSELRKYDIVLTTYATVANEYKNREDSDRSTILPLVKFFRIVLDEAHTIKEISTQNSQAAIHLSGQHRWCLTATPVQNSLNDLAALFAFLNLDPFDSRQVWTQYISQPMKTGDPIAVSRLQTLLKMRVLRRTKDQGENAEKLLSLPPRTEEIRTLKLDEEEQAIYNTHLEYYQKRTRGLGKLMSTINVLQNINQLRQICISTALLPTLDPKGPDGAPSDTATMSEEELLELVDGELCAVCKSTIEAGEDESKAYYTPKCLHFFCNEHGSTATGHDVKCPAPDCKGQGPLKALASNARSKVEVKSKKKKKVDQSPPYSTKIKALLTDLTLIQEEDSGQDVPIKSIVFSQFTSFLDLIALALNDLEFPYARLDGSMAREERTAQLLKFKEDSSLRVMLVSTRAGGVGLNLTMASRVFLMEPSWNPSIEAQACDRVHRIGQTKPVSYTRYIVEESIEQTMLKLQTQKKNLANLSLSGKLGGDDSITKSLLDLRKLF